MPCPGISTNMLRPCYLVIDRETSNGISTRRLVIETEAKFNVITAYSSHEAIHDTLKSSRQSMVSSPTPA